MSEDARKDCRTQGKYSDRRQYSDDRRPEKRQDKRQKVSPSVREPQERKFHKRKSDGGKESSTSLNSESESSVRYQENSDYSFSQLEEVKRPIEIKDPGKHTLSVTEMGESLVYYDPYFFERDEALELMNRLQNTTKWHEKNIVIHGVEYPQPRLVAWYGPFPYSYSGATLEAAEMPDCVLEIKKKVEDYLGRNGIIVELNSVLLNLYRHNKDSVAWHSDDEMSMGVCPTIASVSLGETRKFEMRRKLKQPEDGRTCVKHDEYFVHLRNGSLIVMDGCMQKDWQHRVPKEYHDRGGRINLTFRTVYELENLSPSPATCSKNLPIDNHLKKFHRNKTDYGVNCDIENFPPLISICIPKVSKKYQDSPNWDCSPDSSKKYQDSPTNWDYSPDSSIKYQDSPTNWDCSPDSSKKYQDSPTNWDGSKKYQDSAVSWDCNPDSSTKYQDSAVNWDYSPDSSKKTQDSAANWDCSPDSSKKYPDSAANWDCSPDSSKKYQDSAANWDCSPDSSIKYQDSAVKWDCSPDSSKKFQDSPTIWDCSPGSTEKSQDSPTNWDNSPDISKKSQDSSTNWDSSTVSSNTAKKSLNSWGPKVIKTDNEFRGSQRRRDNENSSYNKRPLKSNNETTGTEETCNSEPLPRNKTSFKTNDRVRKSDRDWSGKFNESHKRRDNGNFSYNKTSFRSHYKISGTEETREREQLSHYKVSGTEEAREREQLSHYKISGTEEAREREQLPRNKTSFKTEDRVHRSERNWSSKYTNNKTALKTHVKINEPGEISNGEPSSHGKTSLKNSNKSNGSDGLWDNESSPIDDNCLQSDAEIKESKKSANRPSPNKKNSLLNNLNDDKKHLKIVQNKNLHPYAPNFSSNSVVNDTAKDKSFGPKENHYVPTSSPDHNMPENDYEVENEPTSNKDNRWTPNVEAKEFVPNKCTALPEDNTYGSFGLENLLNYNVEFMLGDHLKDYSLSLRSRVLEKMEDFRHSDQEELEVLCEITDGTQSDKNQRTITSRIMHIVEKALKHQASPNFRKSYGVPRKPNHGNQNYYPERRYQGGGRESHRRY